MIWAAIALLVVASLAPLSWCLRGRLGARGRREAALALHRAQLVELDRDLDEGRLLAPEHTIARLEIQRRLLAEADRVEGVVETGSRGPLLLGLVLIPLFALGLYLEHGHPELPAQPLATVRAQAAREAARDDELIAALRKMITTLDPSSEKARQGYVILGNIEAGRGHFDVAADAWRHALAVRFEPSIAMEAAESATRAEGHVSPASVELFRRALAEAPPDAPWRDLVRQRLQEAQGQ